MSHFAVGPYEAVINSGTGHAIEAHFRLGIAYLLGQGARQNDEKALYHLKSAANAGHSLVCLNIAIMYEEQYVTFDNTDENINAWLLKAAISNVMDAQARIAKRYLRGAGMNAPNLERAHYWFEKAANNGMWIVNALLQPHIIKVMVLCRTLRYLKNI